MAFARRGHQRWLETRPDRRVATRPGFGRALVTQDGRWLSFGEWIGPVQPGTPPPEAEWIHVFDRADGSGERLCGWSPDGRLLYLLLEPDGFRDLYAQRIDPASGRPSGAPFVVHHLHDPRPRWGSTPLGTAIVSNAFVFSQVEITGSIWLLDGGNVASTTTIR